MSVSRVFGGVILAVAAVTAAQAQTTTAAPEASPAEQTSEVTNPLASRAQVAPVLRFLQAKGVKLTSLGTEGSLPAYLGESPNSQMQIFYVTPDGEHVIAGLMFDSQGNNITGVQLGEMQRRFEAAQKQLGKAPPTAPGNAQAVSEASEALKAQAAPAPAPEAPKPAQLTGSSGIELPPAPQVGSNAAPGPAAQAPAPKAPVSDSQAPAAAPAIKPDKQAAADPVEVKPAVTAASAEKWVSSLDRGAIERALNDTPWFRVGLETAPAIYMVVDPQCPFCHAAWARLKDLVWGRKLQIRVIMIAGLKGSLPKAISILSREPGKAWFEGEGSTDGVEIAPPPAESSAEYALAQKALVKNAAFVRQFGLNRTPTMMYIGKDNRLYSSEGLPEDAGAFLAGLN